MSFYFNGTQKIILEGILEDLYEIFKFSLGKIIFAVLNLILDNNLVFYLFFMSF
jgi:hypothetical protein